MGRIQGYRFHYKGHICPAFFDASRTLNADEYKKTGAQSINARISVIEHYFRYLRRYNVIPFLRVHAALTNVNSLTLKRFSRADVYYMETVSFFRQFYFSHVAIAEVFNQAWKKISYLFWEQLWYGRRRVLCGC